MLDVLQNLKAQEDDGECQILINYAISAVEERLKGQQPKPAKKIKEEQDFTAAWNSADDNQKMRMLSELPARLPAGLKTIGPSLLVTEKSSIIASRIIRIFCRSWPEEQFNLISDHLSSESLSLRLASLRTIVHLKPELLIDDLPALLNSEDPQIKALAIRGLVKIDKEEALNHLQALLLSSNLSDRLAGIQNCPFLPFEMVKPVLLKYFAAENHPDLLIRAGWILEMNPDVQVPFKLFEIAERSPAKKSELVKKILNDAVKLLEKSRILGDDFKKYTSRLQVWVNKRNALRFAQKIVQRLEAEEIPKELDQTIRNSLKQALSREAFAEALSWPVSETVKSRISAYLKSCSDAESIAAAPKAEIGRKTSTEPKTPVKEAEKAEPKITLPPKAKAEKQPEPKIRQHEQGTEPDLVASAEPSLVGKSDEETFTILAASDIKPSQKLYREVLNLTANRNSSIELRIAALHCLTRNKLSGAEEISEKLVVGNEIMLATAAVEYLGEVDPERVFPYIGQCLKVADVHMKSAALGILKNFDFNQAVSSLNAMLRSPDPEQQRMALECMEQFDFALIREQLTEFLEKSANEVLIESGLCYFAANPAAENAYCLYKIERAHGGKIASHAQQLRESCAKLVRDSEIAIDQTETIAATPTIDSLKQRFDQEQEKKKQARPAYAYREKVKSESPDTRQTLAMLLVTLREFATAKSSYIILLILVILALGFYTLFMPGQAPDPNQGRGNAIITGQYLREGVIRRISGTAVEFESSNGEKFVFHPVRDGYRMPSINAKLRVSLVPYRKDPKGVFLARVRAMREIEGFSEQEAGK